MMPGIMGGLAAMVLVKYLFPIWFALPKGYAESGPSAEEIEKQFADRGYNPVTRAALTASAAVLAWCGFVAVFAVICGLRGKGQSAETLLPDIVFYFLPGMFGAMGAGIWAYGVALRKLLRTAGPNGDDAYPLYVRLHNLKNNYRHENVGRVLTGVVAVPTILMLILVADNYTRFDSDGITLNPFFSLGETRHSYSDIAQIVTAPRLYAPNGNAVERRVYVIRFKGGDTWNSDNAPGEHTDSEFGQIVQGVSQKSGVAVKEQEIFRRDEL
ncbi:MAG: hypothetical protein H8F28_20720 [Fibrella sp.]|nr:hypothetical protein [Armatimonadota bacterium]